MGVHYFSVALGGIGAVVNGIDYALYYQPNADSWAVERYCIVVLNGVGLIGGDFSLSETPLPAELPLFAGHLSLIGVIGRRSRSKRQLDLVAKRFGRSRC
jgi:hypothetical protein